MNYELHFMSYELHFMSYISEKAILLEFLKNMLTYHPASEHLAGRKFASRMFGWNNTFTYNTENKAL